MRVRAAVIAIVMLGACVVTRAPRLDERPRWRLTTVPAWSAGCVLGEAWVRKSGKEGFALALRLRSIQTCRVAIAGGTLSLDGGGQIKLPPIAQHDLVGRSLIYTWVPVRFDNDAAWNDEHHRATLTLDMVVDGAAAPWAMPLEQK